MASDQLIRKRSQISRASKTMFIWVAVASVIVSFAAVASVFLVQKLAFNIKVINEMNTTVSRLDGNNKAIKKLQTEIRVLDTNTALATSKANSSDQSLQVILDALPSEANSLALGASLQTRLLAGIEGLTLESLNVTPVAGVESIANDDGSVSSSEETDDEEVAPSIDFSFVVSGNQASLKQVLNNLERSIRTIHVLSVQIENQDAQQIMTVNARAFYQPAREVKLYDTVVKP